MIETIKQCSFCFCKNRISRQGTWNQVQGLAFLAFCQCKIAYVWTKELEQVIISSRIES